MPWTQKDKDSLLKVLRDVKGELNESKLRNIRNEVKKTEDYKGERIKTKIMGQTVKMSLHEICISAIRTYADLLKSYDPQKTLRKIKEYEKECSIAKSKLDKAKSHLEEAKGLLKSAEDEFKRGKKRFEEAKRKRDEQEVVTASKLFYDAEKKLKTQKSSFEDAEKEYDAARGNFANFDVFLSCENRKQSEAKAISTTNVERLIKTIEGVQPDE